MYSKNVFIVHISIVIIETVHLIPILPCFVNVMKNAMRHKMSKNGIFWHFMTHGIFHNIDKIWHYGYQMNRLNNYNWYMKYENIFWIEFFTKNGNFAFDPFFLCIWAEIPLYLKYGESRMNLSSKLIFFCIFSLYYTHRTSFQRENLASLKFWNFDTPFW